MYMTKTAQLPILIGETMKVNDSRPLATIFDTRNKKRLTTLARTIGDFSEEASMATFRGEPYAFHCNGTLIYPKGLVIWGDVLEFSMINYIINYLDNDEGIPSQRVTEFPVTITFTDEQIVLEREWWAPRHVKNIERILTSKQDLLADALGIAQEQVMFEREGEQLFFNWFTDSTSEQLRTSLPLLLGGIHAHAATSRKLQASSRATGNPRYVMRCWLMRLGFNGPEYHQMRVALGKNLTGSAAHRITPGTVDADA